MRHLSEKEKNLIRCLLPESSNIDLDLLKVEEMDDGGMGSIYFVIDQKTWKERRWGKCISEKQFSDSDNVPILVSLNVDDDGSLFELDVWKVDFSPVIKFPEC